ncbi:Fc.00g101830.m01.CDS01 [Cosmosporella sp. VM-42]
MDEERIKEAFGQISWLEIPVRDVDRAKKFYTEVFQWQFSPEKDNMKPVGDCVKSMHFFSKGKLNGALLEHDEKYHAINFKEDVPEALPVLPTFCTFDCDETLEVGKRFGGKTALPKTAIPNNMGFFARLVDSEGNLVGLWSQK